MATNTIWLRVSNVRFNGESKPKPTCEVQLEGDRQDPKPEWWTVTPKATGDKKNGLDNYRAIAGEMDNRRVVLAGMTWRETAGLQCSMIRFQAAEQNNR